MLETDKLKDAYISPECKVLEIESSGIVCASGGGEDMEWI